MENRILPKKGDRVALVHDFLTSFGGAERVLQSLRKLYPEAPVYTLLSDAEIVERLGIPAKLVRTSWLRHFPAFLRKRPRLLLPFFAVAVESYDLRDYDLVISSSGAWSKGIVTRLHTRHIAYLHSPMRFAWDEHASYLKNLGLSKPFRILGRLMLTYLRVWDFGAADRPDVLLANSDYTRKRIAKYYRKESRVVYPPVSFGTLSAPVPKGDYFLVVSRLTRSKKIGMAVEAMNKLGLALKVAGTGPEEDALRKMAGKKIEFLGKVSDEELPGLYGGARALIIPSEEDFGLVAVEALSAGTPVIAYGSGGAREIVEDGRTGLFFLSDLPEILAEAIKRFLEKEEDFDPVVLRQAAERFAEERFLAEMRQLIGESSQD